MDRAESSKQRAMLAINDHLGETVALVLYADDGSDGPVAGTLIEVRGRLARLYGPESIAHMPTWERDIHAGVYMIGSQLLDIAAAPGPIQPDGDGLCCCISHNLTLSLRWEETDSGQQLPAG